MGLGSSQRGTGARLRSLETAILEQVYAQKEPEPECELGNSFK